MEEELELQLNDDENKENKQDEDPQSEKGQNPKIDKPKAKPTQDLHNQQKEKHDTNDTNNHNQTPEHKQPNASDITTDNKTESGAVAGQKSPCTQKNDSTITNKDK